MASSSSSSSPLAPERPPVVVTFDNRGFAIVSLQKAPVNSLDLSAWQALDAALDQVLARPDVLGVIFVSGLPVSPSPRKPEPALQKRSSPAKKQQRRAIFSAGNDLRELYPPSTTRAKFAAFWAAQNRFLARLYAFPKPTVAAIDGACPAGGCVLSLCCDRRIMVATDPYDNPAVNEKINPLAVGSTGGTVENIRKRGTPPAGQFGLNEVALGISVPKYWAKLLHQTAVSRGAADRMLLGGRLISPEEALALGLVDKLVYGEEADEEAEAGRNLGEEAGLVGIRLDGVQRRLRSAAEATMLEMLAVANSEATTASSVDSKNSQAVSSRGASRGLSPLVASTMAALASTKAGLRGEFSRQWVEEIDREGEEAWKQLSSPETLQRLAAVMARLSGRKGKGGGTDQKRQNGDVVSSTNSNVPTSRL